MRCPDVRVVSETQPPDDKLQKAIQGDDLLTMILALFMRDHFFRRIAVELNPKRGKTFLHRKSAANYLSDMFDQNNQCRSQS